MADRQTDPPADARSMQLGQCRHQAHSPCSPSPPSPSSKRLTLSLAAGSPDVTAARRPRHRGAPLQQAQSRSAGSCVRPGASCRAGGEERGARCAVRAAAAGRRWAGARGQVRGWAPLSLGPPEALQESGADTRVPPGVGRAPGWVGTVSLQGPGCSDSTSRADIPARSVPGGREGNRGSGGLREQLAPGTAR